MSTSISIFPFSQIECKGAMQAISETFMKLSGVDSIDIKIAIHNENRDGIMRWMDGSEIIRRIDNVWYSVWEINYIKAGALLDISLPYVSCKENFESIPPVLSVFEIAFKKNAMLLLQICTAFGFAKSMGRKSVFHTGDFGWFVGLYETPPCVYENKALVGEYDFYIPMSLIDNMPAAKKVNSMDQAVLNFFETYRLT